MSFGNIEYTERLETENKRLRKLLLSFADRYKGAADKEQMVENFIEDIEEIIE